MYRSFARALGACALSLFGMTQPVDAADRERLGYGRLITNDYIGDGQDRWRTGSWSASRVWGPQWQGDVPASFGDLIELRLAAEIFAPDNLEQVAAGDRPYAGAVSIGAHTHFDHAGFDVALGADIVVTGAGTGLGSFQRELHKVLGVPQPDAATLENQISGGFHPTLVAEVARDLELAAQVHLRPFLEGRAGAESLVRAGFDLTFGTFGENDLLIREAGTGQRYRAVSGVQTTGFSFVLGADIAHVNSSIFLPSARGYDLVNSRERLRAGLHWQGETASAFYGLTYLGKEFEAQTEGQIVGSVRIDLRF